MKPWMVENLVFCYYLFLVIGALLNNNKDQVTKFQPKANEAIFVWYSVKSKIYRVLNGRIRVMEESFDITFDDNFIC